MKTHYGLVSSIIAIIGGVAFARFFSESSWDSPVILVFVAIFLIGVFLDYYFGVIRAPLMTTKAKVLHISSFNVEKNSSFLLPNKEVLELSIGLINMSKIEKGDIVILKYKGWEVKSVEKVTSPPKAKTPPSSQKTVKRTPNSTTDGYKRWD